MTAGIQVSSSGGIIAFQWAGGTAAGTSEVTAISVDGTMHGHYDFEIAPGPATGPVDLFPVRPGQTAPGPVSL